MIQKHQLFFIRDFGLKLVTSNSLFAAFIAFCLLCSLVGVEGWVDSGVGFSESDTMLYR